MKILYQFVLAIDSSIVRQNVKIQTNVISANEKSVNRYKRMALPSFDDIFESFERDQPLWEYPYKELCLIGKGHK